MDVTIREVDTYFEAVRRLDRHTVDTQVYGFIAIFTGMMAWRFWQPVPLMIAVPFALIAIYNFIRQYQERKIVKRLWPRVQMFIRFYNLAGAGEPILDEVA